MDSDPERALKTGTSSGQWPRKSTENRDVKWTVTQKEHWKQGRQVDSDPERALKTGTSSGQWPRKSSENRDVKWTVTQKELWKQGRQVDSVARATLLIVCFQWDIFSFGSLFSRACLFTSRATYPVTTACACVLVGLCACVLACGQEVVNYTCLKILQLRMRLIMIHECQKTSRLMNVKNIINAWKLAD